MNNQLKEFLVLLKALDKYSVDYVLIGGVAMIIHGFERLTQDIDVFIRLTPENVQKLIDALESLYSDKSIESITTSELERYSVIRYGTPRDYYIDIITQLGEDFSFDDLDYQTIEYKGIKIKIITPESLFKLKKDSLREKDKLDVNFLREILLDENID